MFTPPLKPCIACSCYVCTMLRTALRRAPTLAANAVRPGDRVAECPCELCVRINNEPECS
jgi:hypothetical protein